LKESVDVEYKKDVAQRAQLAFIRTPSTMMSMVSSFNEGPNLAKSSSAQSIFAPVIDSKFLSMLPDCVRTKWSQLSQTTQDSVKGGLMSCLAAVIQVLIFCQCNNKSVSETVEMMVTVGGAAALLGSFTVWVVRQLGDIVMTWNEPIRGVLVGMGIEMTEAGISQLVYGSMGACFSSIIDIIAYLNVNGFPNTCTKIKKFVQVICDSLLVSGTVVAVGSVVAYFTPMFITIIIVAVFSYFLSKMRQRIVDCEGNTLIGALAKGLAGIPLALFRVFFPTTLASNPEMIPSELVCDITNLKLQDPVCLAGFIVERSVAMNQIQTKGQNFYNVDATVDDIVELPDLKRLMARYNAINGL